MSERESKRPPGPVDPSTKVRVGAGQALVRLSSHELVAIAGPDKGKVFELAGPRAEIGQGAGSDVRLADPAVSRRHLCIEETDRGCLLRDLGSTNGTAVDGVRVREVFVGPGALIELGDTTLLLRRRLDAAPTPDAAGDFAGLIGRSGAMVALFARLDQLAATGLSVILLGETGTGKELVARAIHRRGPRAPHPFVVFDCASTEASLMAAALFGHTAGAFTGAVGPRQGAFLAAHSGTLFIDEVGELPLDLQPKLLRVLETKEVQAVGSDVTRRVDVRIVAATHRDLNEMVGQGRFRQDLFYRLSGLSVEIPPLRERADDIVPLARHFLAAIQPTLSLGPSAESALCAHSWPGNVREIRNVIERSTALARGVTVLESSHLVFDAPRTGPGSSPTGGGVRSLEEAERQTIEEVLRSVRWNKVEASRVLGITRKTLDVKIEKYGLAKPPRP